MTDGYLSKDREHIAGRQRQRRARMARIDYYPSPDALALIESRRTRYGRTNNNSGIIDTIIAEWAKLAGLKQTEIDKPTSPATSPGVAEHYARMGTTAASRTSTRAGTSSAAPELSDTSRACAGARKTSATPECLPASHARARTNDFDPTHGKPAPPREGTTAAPEFFDASTRAKESGSLPAGNKARVVCGARRRRDGQPCQGLSVPGKRRCKWHGGASTGPRTEEGRARSMTNLRQYLRREIDAAQTTIDMDRPMHAGKQT